MNIENKNGEQLADALQRAETTGYHRGFMAGFAAGMESATKQMADVVRAAGVEFSGHQCATDMVKLASDLLGQTPKEDA